MIKLKIKDIMAYLKLILNDDDDTAFIRAITTPKRGIKLPLINYQPMLPVVEFRFRFLFEEGFAAECNPCAIREMFWILAILLTISNFAKLKNLPRFT